jgi:succinoglycan biosynthesis protein ExoV
VILYQWRGAEPNFGDELNALLWPALLPGFFDADPSVRFLGIGSVLDSRHDAAATLVAGAGYGGYESPAVLDRSWIIHWVRGPRTARLLGLDADTGLGDPASLLPATGVRARDDRRVIGFMPYFESMARGHWAEAAGAAGLGLIDPRGDPAGIVDAIGGCRVMISEALHGIIVADALRIPWIAVCPLVRMHRPKWLDWADSLDLHVAFRRLTPSSLLEHAVRLPMAGRRPGRYLLTSQAARLRAAARERLVERAALGLRRLAAEPAQLSADMALDRGQARMQERLVALRRAPFRGVGNSRIIARRPSHLRAEDEFAYHPVSTG